MSTTTMGTPTHQVTVLMLGLVSTAFVDATLRDLAEILAASLRDDTLPRLEALG